MALASRIFSKVVVLLWHGIRKLDGDFLCKAFIKEFAKIPSKISVVKMPKIATNLGFLPNFP